MTNKNRLKWFPLFSTNFAGVLNDNLLKNLIGFVCVAWLGADFKSTLVSLAAALLVVPYIFLSPWSGRLAKEYPKAKVIQFAKLAEIPIMIITIAGFLFSNVYLVLTGMFLMGLQSCVYSPSKYGIIRDIGGVEGISFGTGAMEMITFLAVLLGTFFAGVISDVDKSENFQLIVLSISLMGLAVMGYVFSLKIHPTESLPEEDIDDTLNPFLFPLHWFNWSKKIIGLNYVVLGLSLFWFIGSLVQMNLYIYCESFLKVSNTATGTIMALVAIGIGLGCYVAGILSKHTVKISITVVGGIGMTVAMFLILVVPTNVTVFTILIIVFAFFAGLFKIPLNAYIQDRVKGRELGPVLAYNNQMVFVAILIASGLFYALDRLFDARIVFLSVLIITIIATIIVFRNVPGSGKKGKK